MGMASEFKTFVQRGNVIDMAIGIIMGGAFGKIVSSLVGDVLMPPVGLALGGVNFADLKATIGGSAEAKMASYKWSIRIKELWKNLVGITYRS